MNTCLHHAERGAEFVCAVCGKYFCEECVAERYYPSPGYICHHCSGEKPSESSQPPPQHPIAEKVSRDSIPVVRTPVLTLRIEWAVIILCVFVITGLGLYRYAETEWKPKLVSARPDDVAAYCLSVINVMESRRTVPTLEDVASVCPDPISVKQESRGIVVTTPDAIVYGFSEVEIALGPLTVTVME